MTDEEEIQVKEVCSGCGGLDYLFMHDCKAFALNFAEETDNRERYSLKEPKAGSVEELEDNSTNSEE